MTPAEAKAKQDRFPRELRPHPDYEYEGPREVVINGRKCVEVDAGFVELSKLGEKWK